MSADDVPDPATGLSKKEKDIIRNTWAIMKEDTKGNGYGLFERFFTENPSYQQLFKGFKDVPISEFRGNKKVLAHVNSVMYALTALVDNLEDTECLVEMLSKLSENHFNRKIEVVMFQNLGVTIVGYLVDKLGPSLMDDKAVVAWKKTYGVILSVVQKVFDEAAKGAA